MTTDPRSAEKPPSPERVASIAVEDQVISGSGILRFIAEKRLEKVEDLLGRVEETDQFVRTAARNALAPRGYGTATPPPEMPKTFVERINSSLISRNVRKYIKLERRARLIGSVWAGRKSPNNSSRLGPASSDPNAVTSYNVALGIKRNDTEPIVSFSKPRGQRETRRMRNNRTRAKRRYDRLVKKRNSVQTRIKTTESGETFLGKRRSKKIIALKNKQVRYKTKLKKR